MKAKGKTPTDDRWKAKYQEPEPVDESGLPELPEGWCWASIRELSEVGTGATPKRGRSEYWADGSIPWVTSGSLNQPVVSTPTEHTTTRALAETNLTLYPPGTLLMAMYGEGKTRGKCAVLGIEATTNQAIAAIQVPSIFATTRDILGRFLQHNYETTRAIASGGVQPNLNLEMVRSICVPLPPESEQTVLLDALELYLKRCSSLEQTLLMDDFALERLDKAILGKAFRGELVPHDPNDEPASVLLERIRTESGVQPKQASRRRKAKTA